jgi:hypothetical protein
MRNPVGERFSYKLATWNFFSPAKPFISSYVAPG